MTSAAVVRDPVLRAWHRRFFVVAEPLRVRRAFTATGAARIASRAPAARWRSTLKSKWDQQLEREEGCRRSVGS